MFKEQSRSWLSGDRTHLQKLKVKHHSKIQTLKSCFPWETGGTGTGLGIYKRKNENTQERKHARVHANTHENTHSYKKASTQKRTRTRKHACKHALVHDFLVFVRVFVRVFFFSFINSQPSCRGWIKRVSWVSCLSIAGSLGWRRFIHSNIFFLLYFFIYWPHYSAINPHMKEYASDQSRILVSDLVNESSRNKKPDSL